MRRTVCARIGELGSTSTANMAFAGIGQKPPCSHATSRRRAMLRDFITYLAVAIAAGGVIGWLFAKRQTATLQESLDRLNARVQALAPQNEEQREVARRDEERMRLAYQQAADWVKLTNNVTWTMSSIYL